MSDHIRLMGKQDAAVAAELHRAGIHKGFLSSLGHGFLRQLYRAIPSCPSGFGFVWEGDDAKVLGFIACAESLDRLYRQALLRRGVLIALPLLRSLFRPKVIRRITKTLRYPSEVEKGLPAAELLSIVVSPEARGKGVGKALVAAAVEEFHRRGIEQFKVAVGPWNTSANKLYQRSGFRLALQRAHHDGRPWNVYVMGPRQGRDRDR